MSVRMTEHIALRTKPIRINRFNGTTARTANGFFLFAPSSKTTDVRLMSTLQLVAPPDDIVLFFRALLGQLTDLTRPFGTVGNKFHIMNALIAFVVQINV